MKSAILSFVFLCCAVVGLHAQSVNDSLRLEIIDIAPGQYGNYNLRIAIENCTKEYRYGLSYRPLKFCEDDTPCWLVNFELEYKDGEKRRFTGAGVFFMENVDLRTAMSLLPGERRTHIMPLFYDGTTVSVQHAIAADGKHRSADIKRIRFLNGTAVIRELNVEDLEQRLKSTVGYRENTIASNWFYLNLK